jgi:hypothetical protein
MASINANVPLNDDWTQIYILLDKSGSMINLNPENTSKQVTGLVREQTGGRVTVTVARFSDQYEVIKSNVNGGDFEITPNDICPNGPTALQESLCRIIDDAGAELNQMTNERPGKVVVIVLTDGEENASQGNYAGESGRRMLSEKIKHQQEVYNWIFYFLGTNIDAIKVGKSFGIDQRTCINYNSSQNGCTNVMRSASHALNRVRFAPSLATPGMNRDTMLNTGGFTQLERTISTRADVVDVSQNNFADILNAGIHRNASIVGIPTPIGTSAGGNIDSS